MKLSLIVLISLACGIAAYPQTQPTSTGKAEASGTCVLANTGKISSVNIQCGIGAAQGAKMIEILNKILANQDKLPPDVVMEKLEEILQAVNPNVAPKTYLCVGTWISTGPGATAAMEMKQGGDTIAFDQMMALNNAHNFLALRDQCLAEIKEKPGWLTPRLFCSMAYRGLKDLPNAIKMRDEYISRKGPRYETDQCPDMERFLLTNMDR